MKLTTDLILSSHPLQHTATYCNILQHTATHYNTLQHTITHCNRIAVSRHSLWKRNVQKLPVTFLWTRLIYMCSVTHSQVSHGKSHSVQQAWKWTHSYVRHNCIRICDLTAHSYVCHAWNFLQEKNAWHSFFTTLQHTATHCNTLQHTATTAKHCKTLQHTATTLKHIATHLLSWNSLRKRNAWKPLLI